MFDLNPLATLIEGYRAVLIGEAGPGALQLAAVFVVGLVVAVARACCCSGASSPAS